MSLSKPRHQTQNLKVFILANINHYFFNILIYLADLSSLLRDSTVIEEEERQGSSSDSSTCLVGTTTQGLDGTAPQKGEIFNVEKGRMFCPETKECTDFLFGCFDCDQLSSIDGHQASESGSKGPL